MGCAGPRTHTQKPEGDAGHQLLLLSTSIAVSQGLSLNLELTAGLGQLASEPQGSFCLCLPSRGMTGGLLLCLAFTWVLGTQTLFFMIDR